MAKDLAVVVIHGMGSQEPTFAEAMIDELTRRITGSERVAWQSIFWADITKAARRLLEGSEKEAFA